MDEDVGEIRVLRSKKESTLYAGKQGGQGSSRSGGVVGEKERNGKGLNEEPRYETVRRYLRVLELYVWEGWLELNMGSVPQSTKR